MNLLPFISSSRGLVPASLTSLRDSAGASQLTPEQLERLRTALHPSCITTKRNPESQHPVLISIDNSLSMRGNAIDELNCALQNGFAPEMQSEPLLARSLLVGLVGFSRSANPAWKFLHPFAPPAEFRPATILAETGTPHCRRLTEVIPMLAQVTEAMRQAFEVPMRHAWYFDFTDGESMDMDFHQKAQHASHVVARDSGIECFFFGVGPKADMPYLRSLEQPGKPAQLLSSVGGWQQFFRWLYQSIRVASQSMVGDEIELPNWDGGEPFRVRT